MPITSVTKDLEAPSLTVTVEVPVPLQRLWDAYMDARTIERFWGPPEFPATFTQHEPRAGGVSKYEMVGPEGERSGGYWNWVAVDELRSFEVEDGFSHDDGTPNTEMPHMRMVFSFEETADGSQVSTTTVFGSREELEQLMEMGMEEGMRSAIGQIDAVLAE